MTDDRDEHQRGQDKGITLALRAAQWELDTVADHLMDGRVKPEEWKELLTALEHLRDLVRMRSGDLSGPEFRHNASDTHRMETE